MTPREISDPVSIRPIVDVDDAGVDRAQIRAMLELTPEERLRVVEEFLDSVAEIRKASGW